MNTVTTPVIQLPGYIGAPFEGGFYGGCIRVGGAIVPWIWAPKAVGELKGCWLPRYDDVPGATSCFAAMQNTMAMAVAGSQLAQQALDLVIDGVGGWCLPSRDMLEMGYRYLKPTTQENSCTFRDGDNPSSIPPGYPYTEASPAQTSVAAFQAGGPEAFDPEWYWSSTQYSSNYAWLQTFSTGNTHDYGKKFEARSRVVRLILNP